MKPYEKYSDDEIDSLQTQLLSEDIDWQDPIFDDFRSHPKMCLSAITVDASNMQHVNLDLRNQNIEWIKQAININGYTFNFLNEKFQRNKELAMLSVKCCGNVLIDFYYHTNDKEIVLEAMKSEPNVFSNFCINPDLEHWNDNDDVVLLALKHGESNLQYASERIQGLLKDEADPYHAFMAILQKDELVNKIEENNVIELDSMATNKNKARL